MKEEINPALWQELKKHGREMTPEELRQRGVKRVVSIRTSEISRSIERAINRTILERTIGRTDPEELRAFSSAASAEFAAEFQGEEHRGLGEVIQQHRRELQAELEAVHQDLNERRGFVEQQEDPDRWPVPAERLDELRLRVQARLLPIFERLPAGSPPLRTVVADLLEVFAEERASAMAEQHRETDADTLRLERRIAKLVASLEHTEIVLDRLTRESKSAGRASAYREVQGLDPHAADAERRHSVLNEVFHANVDLQTSVVKERAPANGEPHAAEHSAVEHANGES
jgi:hypothetical protein